MGEEADLVLDVRSERREREERRERANLQRVGYPQLEAARRVVGRRAEQTRRERSRELLHVAARAMVALVLSHLG